MFFKSEKQKINRLISDLYFNPQVSDEFQRNPEKIGEKYLVSNKVIEAIKRGDSSELIKLGMNPKFLEDPAFRVTDRVKIWFSKLMVSLILAIGFLGISFPAMARTRKRRKDVGLLRAVNRIINNFNFKVEIEGVVNTLRRNAIRLAGRKERVYRLLRRKGIPPIAIERARNLMRKRTYRVINLRKRIDGWRSSFPGLDNFNSSIILLDPIE